MVLRWCIVCQANTANTYVNSFGVRAECSAFVWLDRTGKMLGQRKRNKNATGQLKWKWKSTPTDLFQNWQKVRQKGKSVCRINDDFINVGYAFHFAFQLYWMTKTWALCRHYVLTCPLYSLICVVNFLSWIIVYIHSHFSVTCKQNQLRSMLWSLQVPVMMVDTHQRWRARLTWMHSR